jgi:hypothetical protein
MWFTLRPLGADYRPVHSFVMTRELAVPAAEAFAILADATEWARWFPGMSQVTWVSPEAERNKPHAVRQADTTSGNVIEHFVVWEDGKRLAFYAERMTSPFVGAFWEDYVIEPAGPSRSRLTWTVGFEPRLVFRPLMFAIRPRFAKMFDEAADALTAYVAKRPRAAAAAA